MWWWLLSSLALLTASINASGTARAVFLVLALGALFVGLAVASARRQRHRDVAFVGLALASRAVIEKSPSDYLDQFHDNPWRSWSKDNDIVLERSFRQVRSAPPYAVAEINFDTHNSDEDIFPFTVSFVIVTLEAGSATSNQCIVPKPYKTFVGTEFLYLYRATSRSHPGDRLNEAALPAAIDQALQCAAQLQKRSNATRR